MSPDEQEALSRRYSNDRIVLLPLSSGAIAIFNSGGDLCDIMYLDNAEDKACIEDIIAHWHPPAAAPAAKPRPTLEELFK